MYKKYKVLKAFRPYQVGQVVDDSTRRVRRKIAEGGGCLEPLNKNSVNSKTEKKMNDQEYDNKMLKKSEENKKGDN